MNAPVRLDPLTELRAAGLTVTLDAGRLVVRPASGLTDAHRQILHDQRDVIVAALEAEAVEQAHLAELDGLILRLAELEAWPPTMLLEVQHARRTMRPCDVTESLAEFRRLVCEVEAASSLPEDRRTCRQCANLAGRRCLAAWRGEIVANRDYEPVRDILRRCEGYAPSP